MPNKIKLKAGGGVRVGEITEKGKKKKFQNTHLMKILSQSYDQIKPKSLDIYL